MGLAGVLNFCYVICSFVILCPKGWVIMSESSIISVTSSSFLVSAFGTGIGGRLVNKDDEIDFLFNYMFSVLYFSAASNAFLAS